jgi:flavin-binding protein dodecin
MSNKTTGKIMWYDNREQRGIIVDADSNEYYFHVSNVSFVKDTANFNPKRGTEVSFSIGKYGAVTVTLPNSKKSTKIKAATKNPFRSEVMLNKILDVYMDACFEYRPSGGWDEYYKSYSLNPTGDFVHFPKITLKFFKSSDLKKQYNTPIAPKTQKGLRAAVKRELLKRIGAVNSYGSNPYSSEYDRLEQRFLESYNVDVTVEFKLKDSEEVYIDRVYSSSTSRTSAIEQAMTRVLIRNTEATLIGYKVS